MLGIPAHVLVVVPAAGTLGRVGKPDGDGAGDAALVGPLALQAAGRHDDAGHDAQGARSSPARKAASCSDTERVTSVSCAFLNTPAVRAFSRALLTASRRETSFSHRS